MSSKHYEESRCGHNLRLLLIILCLIVCLTSYEKWVQGEKCPFKTLLPYHVCVKMFEKEKSNWPFEGTLGKLLTTFYFEMDKVMIYRIVRRYIIPSLHLECIKHDLDIYKFSTFFLP